MTMTWDTHTHAFGPPERYPLAPVRGYDPPPVVARDALDQALAAGLDGVVWMHASIYGFDNRSTLEALAQFPAQSRAVIMPPASVDPAELDALHAAGVRGLRLNILSPGGNTLDSVLPFADEMQRLGWHVAAHIDASDEAMLDTVCNAFAVPVLIEHFGMLGKARAVQPQSWGPMLRWMRAGRLWNKIAAPYHSAIDGPAYASLLPLTRAMAEAGADQLVFASNWPHIGQPTSPSTQDMRQILTPLMRESGLNPDDVLGTNAHRLYA